MIEWTDVTWNPVRGCSRVSEGCRNCYAERQAARFSGDGQPFAGFAGVLADVGGFGRPIKRMVIPRWTGRVELIPEKLDEPLRWRKPRRIFVNSMGDLFHEKLSDEAIAAVFGVMAACPQHTFQVLTKRPERMRAWFEWATPWKLADAVREQKAMPAHLMFGCETKARFAVWPLPNVWLGVSVEDQKTADERIPLLLQTPAALRFVSYEPALGPVDFGSFAPFCHRFPDGEEMPDICTICSPRMLGRTRGDLHWIIVGGESGPGARPCDLAWIRAAVEQCRSTGVPVFVKQLGARPKEDGCEAGHVWIGNNPASLQRIRHPKGGSMGEWPEDLRVREFPVRRALEEAS